MKKILLLLLLSTILTGCTVNKDYNDPQVYIDLLEGEIADLPDDFKNDINDFIKENSIDITSNDINKNISTIINGVVNSNNLTKENFDNIKKQININQNTIDIFIQKINNYSNYSDKQKEVIKQNIEYEMNVLNNFAKYITENSDLIKNKNLKQIYSDYISSSYYPTQKFILK